MKHVKVWEKSSSADHIKDVADSGLVETAALVQMG